MTAPRPWTVVVATPVHAAVIAGLAAAAGLPGAEGWTDAAAAALLSDPAGRGWIGCGGAGSGISGPGGHAIGMEPQGDSAFPRVTDRGWCAGDPAGFLLVRRVLDEADILSIAVIPTRRRQGAAAALLSAGAAALAAAGTTALHLEVAADNAPAQALYSAHGFQQTGRRRGYYRRPGRRVDALTMTRGLVPAP